MRTSLLLTGLIFSGTNALAHFGSNGTVNLETQAITCAGGFAASASSAAYYSVGQPTPLIVTTISNASSRIQLGVIPQLYPRTLPGDANVDGRVDAADITMIQRMIAGSQATPTNIFGLFNVDLNTDGAVAAADVDRLVNRLLGLPF